LTRPIHTRIRTDVLNELHVQLARRVTDVPKRPVVGKSRVEADGLGLQDRSNLTQKLRDSHLGVRVFSDEIPLRRFDSHLELSKYKQHGYDSRQGSALSSARQFAAGSLLMS
jgi:hypothetical protein